MSEVIALTKEQAEWYGKLQDKSVPIVDEVMLHTTNRQTGKVLITGGYERAMLEGWVNRVRRENAGDVLEWLVVECDKGE